MWRRTLVLRRARIICHTMRRGRMRIERQALGLPGSGSAAHLAPP